MRATLHVTPNVAGMCFRIAGRGHHTNPTSVATAVRAVKRSPHMCPWPRFFDRPAVTRRVSDRLSNVPIGVTGHCPALASYLVAGSIIPSRRPAAKRPRPSCASVSTFGLPHGRRKPHNTSLHWCGLALRLFGAYGYSIMALAFRAWLLLVHPPGELGRWAGYHEAPMPGRPGSPGVGDGTRRGKRQTPARTTFQRPRSRPFSAPLLRHLLFGLDAHQPPQRLVANSATSPR